MDLCVPACPRSSIFPLRSSFPRSCTIIFFSFPCAPAFLFRVPSVCVGVGEQLITCALCGQIRQARSTRHCATTLPVMLALCTSLLAGSWFEVRLVSCPQSPHSTSPLSTCHNRGCRSRPFLKFPAPALAPAPYKFRLRLQLLLLLLLLPLPLPLPIVIVILTVIVIVIVVIVKVIVIVIVKS